MIRINLLPVKRKKKPTVVSPFVAVLVIVMVVTGIGLGYASYYVTNRVEELQGLKKKNAARIEELKQKIKEVENYEKNNKEFEEKKKIIERLGKGQDAPIRLLIELVSRLTEGVWIDTLDENSWQIKMTGGGFSNPEIVKFVDSLKGSSYFTNVVLVETNRQDSSETPVYSFVIQMQLDIEKL